MFSGLQVSLCHIHFYVVLVLIVKLTANVLPTPCSSIIQVEEPPKSNPSQSVLKHLSSSLVALRGCLALIYIFKWDFGQPVLSNLSKVGILNLEGNLTSKKVRVIGSQ